MAVILLGTAASAHAQGLDTTAIRQAMLDEMRSTHTPGASIAVVVDGRIAYAQGFGTASIETGAPVTSETLFRIGSVTKVFTGLTALRIAREGKVKLAAPLGSYARGLHESYRALTLHQLLSHTAGIIGEAANTGPHDDAALGARVRAWKGEHRFAPERDVYSYTGAGYWLAGYALEQATGAWYADLVAKHVLAPAGMTRSTFRPTAAMTYPLALDHRVRGDSVALIRPYPDDATTWASGSLFSSATELARFATLLMDGGTVFAPEDVRTLATMQSTVPGSNCGYSYGLSVCTEGETRLSHYGFRVGSGAVFTILPARRAAIVILANRNGGIFGRTERAVLEALGVAGRTGTPDAPPTPMSAAARNRFAGTYVNGTDTLHFIPRGDSLVYRYGTAEQRTAAGARDEIYVLGADGAPEQGFKLVAGAVTKTPYLHDGLSAFRRVAPAGSRRR